MEEMGITESKANDILNIVIDTIEQSLLEGEDITLRRFGRFAVREHKASVRYIPSYGKTIEIAANRTITFTPGSNLRKKLNGVSDEPAPKPKNAIPSLDDADWDNND